MNLYTILDVYWASFNRADNMEKLLRPIALHLNILYIYNTQRYLESKEFSDNFAKLGGDRVIIFNRIRDRINTDYPEALAEERKTFSVFLKKQKTRIIDSYEDIDNGSTIHFIEALFKLGFRKFCLFGYDGICKKGKDHHYNSASYPKEEGLEKPEGESFSNGEILFYDTLKINDYGYSVFSFSEKVVQILNCNPESFITCFKKIDYDEVLINYEGRHDGTDVTSRV